MRLADGENDPKFSPRVLEIAKPTDGPPGVGTVYASTVKDAGMKTKREFELTEFAPPTRIRWGGNAHGQPHCSGTWKAAAIGVSTSPHSADFPSRGS